MYLQIININTYLPTVQGFPVQYRDFNHFGGSVQADRDFTSPVVSQIIPKNVYSDDSIFCNSFCIDDINIKAQLGLYTYSSVY